MAILVVNIRTEEYSRSLYLFALYYLSISLLLKTLLLNGLLVSDMTAIKLVEQNNILSMVNLFL